MIIGDARIGVDRGTAGCRSGVTDTIALWSYALGLWCRTGRLSLRSCGWPGILGPQDKTKVRSTHRLDLAETQLEFGMTGELQQ
jgi:hypothetical protein